MPEGDRPACTSPKGAEGWGHRHGRRPLGGRFILDALGAGRPQTYEADRRACPHFGASAFRGALPLRGPAGGGGSPRLGVGARPPRGRMAEGLGRRPGASPWREKGLIGRCSATTGRARSPPSLPGTRGSDGGGSQALHRRKKADRRAPGNGQRAWHCTCQEKCWRVTEGYAGRRRRGLPATLRGFASPMRDTLGPRAPHV